MASARRVRRRSPLLVDFFVKHPVLAGRSSAAARQNPPVRLHVLSDLHMEHGSEPPPPTDADLVVLAGDIGRGTRGVEWAREWAGDLPVLYVAGNHEFYGHAIPSLIAELRAAADGSGVQILENDEVAVDGVRFLGCTLWSDFDFDGPERREESMAFCGRVVNDFRHIRFDPADRTFAPADARALHLSSRRWLATRLEHPHDGPTVVITHHAPVIRRPARPPLPHLRLIAGAFVSDVSELMGADRVDLWIYGHTHRIADLDIEGTRIVSNPYGYPHEPAVGFDPTCVIELGTTRATVPGGPDVTV
jgi:predicted phosphodiesterase